MKINLDGIYRVYPREDRNPHVAYSQAMGRGILKNDYYVDKPGEDIQLHALLDVVAAGDCVIVGTITDFMNPEINDMLGVLENFADDEVTVESRLEPDYSIEKYSAAIRLADRIAKIRMN